MGRAQLVSADDASNLERMHCWRGPKCLPTPRMTRLGRLATGGIGDRIGRGLAPDADGQVQRAADRFGLIAAAGELATALRSCPGGRGSPEMPPPGSKIAGQSRRHRADRDHCGNCGCAAIFAGFEHPGRCLLPGVERPRRLLPVTTGRYWHEVDKVGRGQLCLLSIAMEMSGVCHAAHDPRVVCHARAFRATEPGFRVDILRWR